MKTLTITISVEIPDGTSVQVGSGAAAPSPVAPAAPRTVPEALDPPDSYEHVPWPADAPSLVPAATQIFAGFDGTAGAPAAAPAWRCPDHGTGAKTVPGGVSKKTGAAYNAFQVCETRGCERRPGR